MTACLKCFFANVCSWDLFETKSLWIHSVPKGHLASNCVAGTCLKLNFCEFTVCHQGNTKATRININSRLENKESII